MKRERIDYWKNIETFSKGTPKEEIEKYKIRDNDSARYYFYRRYLELQGKDTSKIPIDADLLNDMDEWYLDLAQAKIERMQTDERH